jgi:hypothetical protein
MLYFSFVFKILKYISSVGKDIARYVQDQGSNPGTPTYSPLRGEILATRLPNQKKIKYIYIYIYI